MAPQSNSAATGHLQRNRLANARFVVYLRILVPQLSSPCLSATLQTSRKARFEVSFRYGGKQGSSINGVRLHCSQSMRRCRLNVVKEPISPEAPRMSTQAVCTMKDVDPVTRDLLE